MKANRTLKTTSAKTTSTAAQSGRRTLAEFRRIIGKRGETPFSFLRPLSYLGLARAYALKDDNNNARKVYRDFFAFLKHADPNTPMLIEAKREYALIGPVSRTSSGF